MSKTNWTCALALCVLCTPALADKPAGGAAPAPQSPAFEKLKGLAGEWESKGSEGKMRSTYRLTAGGTALMENMGAGTRHEMITMYTPEKGDVWVTHYCASGNQPRMKAKGIEGNQLKFSFVDATNLPDPKAMHMRGLTVTFLDADHFTEEWVSSAGGKEEKATFEYTRVKKAAK